MNPLSEDVQCAEIFAGVASIAGGFRSWAKWISKDHMHAGKSSC